MVKYIVAAVILLLLATKKASAATTSTILPTGTTQRPPEQGVNLGATGARLCCGTAAPIVPGVAPSLSLPGPVAINTPSRVTIAPPIIGRSQIAPVVRQVTYASGPSAATPVAVAPPRLTYNTYWQEVTRRQSAGPRQALLL